MQYPSLFTVQNESVTVADIPPRRTKKLKTEDEAAASEHRDYGREAMLYFKEKILQYGEGIEVPIKSLLGELGFLLDGVKEEYLYWERGASDEKKTRLPSLLSSTS